jgi:glutathione synthase/RimK-type ligase-like ATP-grasp enzyme
VSGPDVVLVTGSEMPVPDTESPLLVAALAGHGLRAEIRVWDEPYGWEKASLVVCRSPWDYFGRADEFLAWTEEVAAVTRFENPAPLVRWNAHKSYLVSLARAGVPIVPTVLVPRGAASAERSAALASAEELVIKPAVGGGALGTRRGHADDPELAEHLAHLTARGDALVQPFMPSVPDRGETSLIFFGGRFSHAVRKVPTDGDFRVQPQYGARSLAHVPTPVELAAADAVLAVVPHEPAYARIDLVEGPAGPLLMEAELIEPFLFLDFDGPAAERFAAVLAGRTG